MGNDGGSIPDRRDLVRTKAKAEQADKANQTKARWFFCALSKRKLQEPIVSCALGKLYNKDAIIEYLLNKQAYGDGEKICGHIRSLKDVKTLKLTPNPAAASPSPSSHSLSSNTADDGPAPFVCALTLKEMNGVQPFVYLSTCGCVFSQAGLRTVSQSVVQSVVKENGKENGKGKAKEGDQAKEPSPEEQQDPDTSLYLCPQCQTKYNPSEDIVPLNPPEEDELRMRFAMEKRRLLEAAEKKEKKSKKRKWGKDEEKSGGTSTGEELPTKKVHTSSTPSNLPHPASSSTPTPRTSTPLSSHPSSRPSSHPTHPSSLPSSLLAELAREEAKRKATMSPALRSLYAGKDGKDGNGKGGGRKETFMTMGTFTRYA